jgi:hypothetical protein
MLYFNSANALTGAAGSIPTSAVVENGNGSCNNNMVIGATTFPNACSTFYQVTLTNNLVNQTANPTFTLAIPTINNYPPGSYSGTVNAQLLVL